METFLELTSFLFFINFVTNPSTKYEELMSDYFLALEFLIRLFWKLFCDIFFMNIVIEVYINVVPIDI